MNKRKQREEKEMTLVTMAVDHEQRIDYDKLRKDRLEKTREQDVYKRQMKRLRALEQA